MDPALQELADAYGVATSYEDWAHRPVAVSERTVREVLGGLGVDVTDPAKAFADWLARSWQTVLPPTVVVRQLAPEPIRLRCPARAEVRVEIHLDPQTVGPQSELVRLEVEEPVYRDRASDRVECHVELPVGLPLGDHRLLAYVDGVAAADSLIVVAPDELPLPAGRLWGWMAQLYAIRSAWGMGDYADLAELVVWSGLQGAGLLLVNPLHAVAPITPVQNSPYYPTSRRFNSPLYLRPEQLPEYAAAPPEARRAVDRSAAQPQFAEQIDRNEVWKHKSEALELLFRYAITRTEAEDSPGLTDFATWCALAERHGPDWRRWPEALRDPASPAVEAAREELSERVGYHRWLQHCCAEQLAAAQRAARSSGMDVGIVHDLAVGVDPGGADAWALQYELATGFSIGAPPDSFNQQGQDWGLPPWRPERLIDSGYAPLRDMVRAVLRTGGGLRIDHILGLFRLWWVPEGRPSAEGTYVSYDADAMLGIVALEAHRVGALVVGEDLGTVPREARVILRERAVLGSTVLWFERDDDGVLVAPAKWRESAMASVTTHDLPTAAGYLTGDHVRVRAELGLLNDPEAEAKSAARERAELLAMLTAEGLLPAQPAGGAPPEPGSEQLSDQIAAVHVLLTRSPSRVVLAALSDAVGDLRQPNLPGTVDEYPNWRLPIADGTGRALSRQELLAAPGAARLAAIMRHL